MKNIYSNNSLKDFIEGLEVLLSKPFLEISGRKLYSNSIHLKEYRIERKGNNIVCYLTEEKNEIEELRKERNELIISKSDPKRLAELTAKLNYFDWGIK